MKQDIENLLQMAIKQLQEDGELPPMQVAVQVEPTKDRQFGDFASNVALTLAKAAQKKPRDIAERIKEMLPPASILQKVEVAGPGFINFYLSSDALNNVVIQIHQQKGDYGHSTIGRGKRILVEFVSSNPTGPLHVGHGRHAAFGAVVVNLLEAVGFKPYREYYVNDAGRQMNILTVSIWLRYLENCGHTLPFPANAYRGDYIRGIAQAIYSQHGRHFDLMPNVIFADLPKDESEGGNKEIYIDAVIDRMKALEADKFEAIFALGLENILADIREDLAEFGVHYDNWFSEKAFVATGVVDQLLEKLMASGHIYEREGATWFRSTDFGDEKDRVLVRSNGTHTYFANDVAYHLNKFERGFDIAINILGSDHHGYTARIKAAVEASGINPERWMHLLIQFVTLSRSGQQVQMSTRGGDFVTLRELRHEVGNDAARFFYVMRKPDQHMDFDLDLAKSKSNENPVYYVQYAYARIASVFKQLEERGLSCDVAQGLTHLSHLTALHERQLLNTLSRYPDIITSAALQYEPHLLTNYLRDLAADFHAYYNAHQFLVDEANLRAARLTLVAAVREVLLNGFKLLGISAPESM